MKRNIQQGEEMESMAQIAANESSKMDSCDVR
jgi:hypothetical protein